MNVNEPLLSIKNLSLAFVNDQNPEGKEKVIDNVSININSSSTHALVGESGSGKSVTALSILRLLEEISEIRMEGEITFNGQPILSLPKKELLHIRGNQIAMIFQEPMTSLNPVYTIGSQLQEPLMLHQQLNKNEARKKIYLPS